MKIGIIGAGGIAQTYARLWIARGHEVVISSRNPEKVSPIEVSPAGRVPVLTAQEAAEFGDVILLAVNYASVDEALDKIRGSAVGKLVIDATNPLQYGPTGAIERVLPDDAIAGLVMAEKLPEARIAKAFTSLWTGHVDAQANVENPTVAMPFATDYVSDYPILLTLIKDAGLVPVNLGGLADSEPLDPQSPIWNVVLSPEDLRRGVAQFRQDTAA